MKGNEEIQQTQQKEQPQEYTVLGNSWRETSETADHASMEKLENYKYFDKAKIEKSMMRTKSCKQKGRQLCDQKKIEIQGINSGFDQLGEILGEIKGLAQDSKGNAFAMNMLFSRTDVVYMECHCPKCRHKYYYNWGQDKIECDYMSGLAEMLLDYLETSGNSLADATSRRGVEVMRAFQAKRTNQILSDAEKMKEESLKLVPRLVRTEKSLSVSFRIGTGKMFVVKKLDDFCENVKKAATDTYGTSTKINHNISNFTEEGKKWISFLNQIVQEEERFSRRLQDSRYYYGRVKSSIGSSLELFGWRLDQFYEKMGDEAIDFEDKWGEKKKLSLKCGIKNPRIYMHIEENHLAGSFQFHGIKVSGTLPLLYEGMQAAYYIEGDRLYKTEPGFMEKIEPLSRYAEGDAFSFDVGRNHMAEFYYRILPQLQDVAKVTESFPEKLHTYLPPEVYFIFYLDAEEKNITCRLHACYGERECSVLEVLVESLEKPLESFRDKMREQEVLVLTQKWIPKLDLEKDELHCGQDEELMYEVMENGVEALMELGEVRCTKRFRDSHIVKKVKISVGVSVSGGLLNLNISTEDVSQKDLLELLKSYRAKKKYYRLKSGEFVNLEGEQSLDMLAEMMDSMHLSPKEFVKGKMHLPIYRTLYLDKMLEENDSIYSHRDRHFKEVVKGFKTVHDADFEEPESLSKIMRNYQKNGFKWLRTLESWKFGGILADDMGLGKTLQIIAVLLSAKEEGRQGTSLVVTPASLVFNWGEEFQRFAPELSVTLVTGTQAERKKKVEAWTDSDVLVTSYDLLKRDIAWYEEKEFQYEVIDEAQYIKNHTTAAAKAVKVIKSQIRFALTGTPIENRLSELWSIFDYLMPGFLYGYDVFKKELETPIVKNKDENAMKRLQKMTAPFILRRLKENVLKDLPDKMEEVRYVQFGSVQQKLYDGQVIHMREKIREQDEEEFNKNRMRILAEITRLRQICCDPSLCFEDYRGEAAKVEACMDLIQSAIDGGHRILVFSQFTSMLEILQKNLEKYGVSYYTIMGSTPKQKRLQLVKEFNEGDVPVFFISLKAGGVGLNLTGADVVIHYDPWWNVAAQNQATDRVHRIGQTKKVTVYKLIMKNSIEEKIQKLQETKRDLADQIIRGETGQLSGMGREELLELLSI